MRTPLLPFAELASWGDGATTIDGLRAGLRAIVDRPIVSEAISVASPSLAAEIDQWKREPGTQHGERIERGLVRYVSRMCGRATPFGEFAGCTVGTTGAATRLSIADHTAYRSHTRLDAVYVAALADELQEHPAIAGTVRYRPNSSLYKIAGQYRYMETIANADGVRRYNLVAVAATKILARVLERSAAGVSRAELIELLAGIASHDEVVAYVDDLIASDVVVAEFPPRVTGPEPLAELIERAAPAADVAEILRGVHGELAAIDARALGGREAAHAAIAGKLATLPTPVDPARLLQVDLVKPGREVTLGADVLGTIAQAIELLHRLGPTRNDHALRGLAADFAHRYEGREVPLVEVLDEEWGIAPANRDPSPLLADLPFGGTGGGRGPGFDPLQGFLARHVAEAAARGDRTITLDRAALEPYATERPAPMPHTLAAMVTVAAASADAIAEGKYTVVIEGINLGSGTSLLGRFCHGDPELAQRVAELAAAERAADPDVIYAEVVHQPHARSGNIVSRPVLSEYELVYLSSSGVALDHQITVDDLMLSVADGEFVVRSKRLDKRIIPRLSNAHTLNGGLLPYRFLGLLSSQPGLNLPLGALDALPYIPRIVVDRAVLHLARWQLFRDEIAALDRPTRAEQLAAVQALRTARGLPRWVAVQDGDNELPIDFDNELSVDSFVQLLKRRDSTRLVELYPGADELCAEGPEGRFVHELVVPFFHDAAPRHAAVRSRAECRAQRRFSPGSEWLYAKLYTATTAADRVLRQVVAPLVEDVTRAGIADGWFFLRYADPEFQVRVRLHAADGAPANAGKLLAALHEHCEGALAGGLLHRVQLDTYERELERYGGDAGIALLERWFAADSDAALAVVGSLDVKTELDARWRIALLGMERLFDDLGFDLATRAGVIRYQRDGFAAEHGVGTLFERGLGAKYRNERLALESLLGDDGKFSVARDAFATRSARTAPIIAEMRDRGLDLPELSKSMVHMHANRVLRSAARAQEVVIYDFLDRCYTSRAARSKGARAGAR